MKEFKKRTLKSNAILKSDIEKKARENINRVSTVNTLNTTKTKTIINKAVDQGKNTINSNTTINNTSKQALNIVKSKVVVRRVNTSPKNIQTENISKNIKRNKVSSNVILKSDVEKKAKENIRSVSILNTLNKTKAKTIIKNPIVNNKNNSTYQMIKSSIKKNTETDDNTATIATAITAGEVSTKIFKASEVATNVLIEKGKGIYHVGDKTLKLTRATNKTITNIRNGTLQLDHETYLKFKSIATKCVKSTSLGKKINHIYTPLKTGYERTINMAQKTKYIYLDTKMKLNIVKGVANGNLKVQVNRAVLLKLKNKGITAIKKNSVLVGKKINTGMNWGLKTGYKASKKSLYVLNKGYKGLRLGVLKGGEILSNQDDLGCQALGNGIKYGNLTIKGIKGTPRVVKGSIKQIKTAVNIPIKTTKNVSHIIKNTKNIGIKRTLQWQKRNAIKVAKKTGESIVSKIVDNFVKGLKKALIPLLVVIIVMLLVATTIQGAGAGAYQTVFGSTATNKDTGKDVEEKEWLTKQITASRKDLIKDVKNIYNKNFKNNGGSYDYVRLFNTVSNKQVDLNDVNILANVYSVSEYLEYIQPIFHVLLLTKYDLEASEFQMKQIYTDIWNKLTKITTKELPMEFCNNGKKEQDGYIHADITTCPNHSDKNIHNDDINKKLCTCDYFYYECLGHQGNLKCDKKEHKHNKKCYDDKDDEELICELEEHKHEKWNSKSKEGCYSTKFCSKGHMSKACSNSQKHLGCNGYYICNGHKVLGVYITVGNFDDLLKQYFKNRIVQLENKKRNNNEEKELKELKENYEICLEYLQAYEEENGGTSSNGNVVDLTGVELTEITEFACQFIGNPYVYGGTDINKGIDCSAFVQYVYSNFGVSLPRVASDQCRVGTLIPNLNEAEPGDLIFYSDDGTDVGVYHVTMYIGEGKMVHASNSKPYPQGGIKVSNVYGKPYKIKRIVK